MSSREPSSRKPSSRRPSSRRPPGRLAPNLALPAYAFVGGGSHPHPNKSAGSHSGLVDNDIRPLNPSNWDTNTAYRYAVDLFNLGYYWEAHEVWEQLWILAGRSGSVADLLKGLIKLAACGLKVRQGMPGGVKKHSLAAHGLFQQLLGELGRTSFCGLSLDELAARAALINATGGEIQGDIHRTVEVVFDFDLNPATRPRPCR